MIILEIILLGNTFGEVEIIQQTKFGTIWKKKIYL